MRMCGQWRRMRRTKCLMRVQAPTVSCPGAGEPALRFSASSGWRPPVECNELRRLPAARNSHGLHGQARSGRRRGLKGSKAIPLRVGDVPFRPAPEKDPPEPLQLAPEIGEFRRFPVQGGRGFSRCGEGLGQPPRKLLQCQGGVCSGPCHGSRSASGILFRNCRESAGPRNGCLRQILEGHGTNQWNAPRETTLERRRRSCLAGCGHADS